MISPILYPPAPPDATSNESNPAAEAAVSGQPGGVAHVNARGFLAPATATLSAEAIRMTKLGIMSSAKAAKAEYLEEEQAIAAKKAGPVTLVLKYLDFLRPLLLRDNSLVTTALARFDFLQSKVIFPNPPLDLMTYEMSSEAEAEVYAFFPAARMHSFDTLISYLSFENTILGKRICLLDILTVLVIILRGTLESKTEFLFQWYNINKTGIMTEVEHIAFIMRLGTILTRIKVLSSIDVTEDDARHIAFTARLKQDKHKRERREAKIVTKDKMEQMRQKHKEAASAAASRPVTGDGEHKDKDVDPLAPHASSATIPAEEDDYGPDEGLTIDPSKGSLHFHPGLTQKEFNRWARYSREGRAISNFVTCLDRLADSLRVLDARTDAIADIILTKEEFHKNSPNVPHLDILPNIKINYGNPVHVICRSHDSITAIVAARHAVDDPTAQVFIKLEKLQTVPNPLYPIPIMTKKSINDRGIQAEHEATPLCCDRVYSLVAYTRNSSVAHPAGVNRGELMQVHIEGLDAYSRYDITVYTEHVQYPKFEAKTLPTPNAISKQQQKPTKPINIAVLPASLSLRDAADFIKSTPSVDVADATVFSGSICSLDKELQDALLFAEAGVRGLFNGTFTASLAASIEVKYKAELEEQCNFMYSMASGVSSGSRMNTEGFTVAHRHKQILYHNGMGPWETPGIALKIQKRLYHESIRVDQNGQQVTGGDDTTENIWLRNRPRSVYLAEQIKQEIERVYKKLVEPLAPPRSSVISNRKLGCASWRHGPFELILMDANGDVEKHCEYEHLRPAPANSTETVIELLTERLHTSADGNAYQDGNDDGIQGAEEKKSKDSNASSEPQPQRLVLVVRSPLDLMKEHSHISQRAILQFHQYQEKAKIIPQKHTIVIEPDMNASLSVTGTPGLNIPGVPNPEEVGEVLMPVFATIVDTPTAEQVEANLAGASKKKVAADSEEQNEEDEEEKEEHEDEINIDELDDEDLEPHELAARNEKRRLAKEEEQRLQSLELQPVVLDDFLADEFLKIIAESQAVIRTEIAHAKLKLHNGGYVPTEWWKVDKHAANFRYKMNKYNTAHGIHTMQGDDDAYEQGHDIIDDRQEVELEVLVNTDDRFKELLTLLMLWMDDESERTVHIVSTGWNGGANFEIYSKTRKLRIIHECLLPTTASVGYNPNKADANGYRARGYTDMYGVFIPEFQHVGLTIDEIIEYENRIKVETLLDRIACSLPEDCTFSLLSASVLRALVMQSSADSSNLLKIVDSHLPINIVTDKNADMDGARIGEVTKTLTDNCEAPDVMVKATSLPSGASVLTGNLPQLAVRDGPKLIRVQSSEALVSVTAEGYGRIKCTLYELPFDVDYYNALSICATNRSQLRKIASVTHRVTKRREVIFPFRDLNPYYTYCVCIDLYHSLLLPNSSLAKIPKPKPAAALTEDGAEEDKEAKDGESEAQAAENVDEGEKSVTPIEDLNRNTVEVYIDPENLLSDPIPLFAHFRTLHDGSGHNSSMVISAVSDADYALPSFTLAKLNELFSCTRPPAANVHLLHCISGLDPKVTLGPEKPGKMDVQRLYRSASVVHLQPAKKTSFSEHKNSATEMFDGVIRPIGRNLDASLLKNKEAAIQAFQGGKVTSLEQEIEDMYSYRSIYALLNVSWNGRFCRITPRDSSWDSLEKVISLMGKMDSWHPEVDNITLFVNKPLVRYLKKEQLPAHVSRFPFPKSNDEDAPQPPPPPTEKETETRHRKARWSYDAKNKHDQDDAVVYAELCSKVIASILYWKARKIGRDCQIIAMAQVKSVKIAVFGFHLKSRAAARAEAKRLSVEQAADMVRLLATAPADVFGGSPGLGRGQEFADDRTLGSASAVPYDLLTSSMQYSVANSSQIIDEATIATHEQSQQASKTGNGENILPLEKRDDETIATVEKTLSPRDDVSIATREPDSNEPQAAEAETGVKEGKEVTAGAEKIVISELEPLPSVGDENSVSVVFKTSKPLLEEGDMLSIRNDPNFDEYDVNRVNSEIELSEVPTRSSNSAGLQHASRIEQMNEDLKQHDLAMGISVNNWDSVSESESDSDDELYALRNPQASFIDAAPQRLEPLVTIRHIILPIWSSEHELPDEYPTWQEVATMTMPALRRARLILEGRPVPPLPVNKVVKVQTAEEGEDGEEFTEEQKKAKEISDQEAAQKKKESESVWHNPEEDDLYVFPSGTYELHGDVEFRFDQNPTNLNKYNISPLPKRADMYGHAIDIHAAQSELAVYLFDIFIRPGEGTQAGAMLGPVPLPIGFMPLGGSLASMSIVSPESISKRKEMVISHAGHGYLPSPSVSVVAGGMPHGSLNGSIHSMEEVMDPLNPEEMSVHNFPEEPQKNLFDRDFHAPMPIPTQHVARDRENHSSEWHFLLPRSFMSELDLAELIVGPVIGEVTQTSARVLFEFNMDLRELAFILRPIGRHAIQNLNKSASDRDMLEIPEPPEEPEGGTEVTGAGTGTGTGSGTGTATATSTKQVVKYDKKGKPIKSKKQPKPGFMFNEKGQEVEIPVPIAVIVQKNIKAFKVFTIEFKNLTPGTLYGVYIPELRSRQKLGVLRTRPVFTRQGQLVIVGANALEGVNGIDVLIHHLKTHQVVDYRHVLRDLNVKYPSKFNNNTFYYEKAEHLAPRSIVGNNGSENRLKMPPHLRQGATCWEWVTEQSLRPHADHSLIVHFGSHTFLSAYFTVIAETLLEHARRIHLPLFEAHAVTAYYFNQFEETIKDTFRLLWTIPTIRDAFSSGTNIFSFISEYLLSFEHLPKHLTDVNQGATEEDIKLLKVIRTVYEQQFLQYITPLYNWNPDAGHHAKIYRTGPLVYIVLDVVSGRKKIKKLKEEVAAPADDGKKKKKKGKEDIGNSFSLGFLDKAQWKLIKDASEDNTITSIVLISYKPFLHLYDLPNNYDTPMEIKKGEMLEWGPTYNDLKLFFTYFVDWMQPQVGKPALHKNFVIVSSHTFPYCSQIQDMSSGVKLQQVCVGVSGSEQLRQEMSAQGIQRQHYDDNASLASLDAPGSLDGGKTIATESNNLSKTIADLKIDKIVVTGRLNKMRYLHKFTELDNLPIDPSRESIGTNSRDRDRSLIFDQIRSLLKPSFGVLTFGFDTWKALGTFQVFDRSMTVHPLPDDIDQSDAILLIGPILGPPRLFESDMQSVTTGKPFVDKVFEVGIMVETDRDTQLVFQVRHSLNGTTFTFKFDVMGRRPFVCRLGPLEPNARFDAKIISGLRESTCMASAFALSTVVHLTEANVVFINCEMVPNALPLADFGKDLLRRYKVPFNGLTVSVHMNSCPEDLSQCLDELKRLDVLKNALANSVTMGHLTLEFYRLLSDVMELIRGVFRRHFSRPSYREVLRNHFTLLMQTRNIFGTVELEIEETEENDEDEEEEEEEDDPDDLPPDELLRLLQLMSMRVYQEYSEQLNNPDSNPYRAKVKPEEDTNELKNDADLTKEERDAIMEEDSRKLAIMDELSIEEVPDEETTLKFNKKADPIKVCFKQWLKGMLPADPKWINYITPNRRVIIELAPSALKKNLPQVLKMFRDKCQIEIGTRIVVVDGNADGSGCDNAFTPGVKVGAKYSKCSQKWLYPNPLFPEGEIVLLPLELGQTVQAEHTKPVIRDDRRVCFVCPTRKYGTMKRAIETLPDYELKDGDHCYFHTVDSFYRSNESERAQKMLQIDAESANALKDLPKATTKKQKENQIKAEELRKKAKMKEIKDMMNAFIPDGYIIVECNTYEMPAPGHVDKYDPISNLNVMCLPSVPGLGTKEEDEIYKDPEAPPRPSPFDYIDLPEWISKYIPSRDGVFAQDEVLLWMRENKITSRTLAILEGPQVFGKIIELYENSRLSELSRPEDLREVDMSLPGVTGRFVKDLMDRLWKEVIPDETKSLLVPVNDDFLRSFLLARAMPNTEESLASADKFASGIQYALVLAVSMKISLTMVEDPRYKHILAEPDAASAAAQFMADRDTLFRLNKEKQRILAEENPVSEEEQATIAKAQKKALLIAAAEAKRAGKNVSAAEAAGGDDSIDVADVEGVVGPSYESDVESDLEELDRENAFMEGETDRLEELEQMNERMLDLKEIEDEDYLAAKEELGLNVEEEEEEEEAEEIPLEDIEDEVERAMAAEQREERKLELMRSKKKSPAEIAAFGEAKTKVLSHEAILKGVDDVLDATWDDAISIYVKEILYDLEQEEKFKNLPLPNDVDRVATAKLHISRMNAERRKLRRKIGPQVMHLT